MGIFNSGLRVVRFLNAFLFPLPLNPKFIGVYWGKWFLQIL